MDTFGMAVVGAGYWGPNLVRNALGDDDVDLRWLVDLDTDLARRVLGTRSTVGVSADLDEVLADPEVRGVAIATPADTHAELVLRCLEAGRHVLVEKPIATSLADAEKLVAVAQERGLTLMCDHTYAYTPVVRALRRLVRDGTLGAVQYVDSVRINLGLVQPDVDVFWDLAPHDVSILEAVLPDDCQPIAVQAHGADPIGAGRSCVGYLTIELPGGAIAHVHVNWLSPVKVRTLIIGGSRRTAVWDDMDPANRLRVYDRGVDMAQAPSADEQREARVSYRTGDMVAPALGAGEALAGVVAEFVRASTTGDAPLTGGASGIYVLRVLEAARRSLERGGARVLLAEVTA